MNTAEEYHSRAITRLTHIISLGSHSTQNANLCSNLLDTSHDTRGVGTTDGLDLLTVLEEEEGGHGGDAVLGRDLGELVDVDLVELDVVVLRAQLLDLRGDGLAGAAPLGEEVNEDGGVLQGLLKLLLAGEYVST